MSQQNGGWGQPPGGGGYPPQGGYGQQPGGYGPPGGGYGPPGGGYGPPGGGFGAPPPGGGFVPPGPMADGGMGVAWENPSLGFMSKWWGTLKESAWPSRAFGAAVARSDEAMPSVTFSLSMFALIGLLFGVVLGVMYAAMGGFAAMAGGKGSGPVGAMMAGMGIGVAILYPLMFAASGFIGPWISGGIYHLFLMMMSGASKSYSSTVRAVGYAAGSVVWLPIPCVGGLMYFIISHIQIILGLDETHKCGTGKAAAAVLLPFAIMMICGCVSYGAIAAFIFSAAPTSTTPAPYHP